MSGLDIRPRAYFTRWYIGSDGSRTALCTLHLRKRQMLGNVEYEVETPNIILDGCSEPCADCRERARTKGDDYSLPLSSLFESIATNANVIWYAMEDITSTLEICADKLETKEHVQIVESEQMKIRLLLDRFDTSLNKKYSLAALLFDMLDDDGNETTGEEGDEDSGL